MPSVPYVNMLVQLMLKCIRHDHFYEMWNLPTQWIVGTHLSVNEIVFLPAHIQEFPEEVLKCDVRGQCRSKPIKKPILIFMLNCFRRSVCLQIAVLVELNSELLKWWIMIGSMTMCKLTVRLLWHDQKRKFLWSPQLVCDRAELCLSNISSINQNPPEMYTKRI